MGEEIIALHLLGLPEIVLEKIFGYMSYEELSNLRIICRRFNEINQQLLNKGFRKVDRYQAKCLKEVKSQLPRRESERRNHPLIRHCDILTAIETRLSLLNMTFAKYVDSQMCCFIPGKVIDEIYEVLRFIQNNKKLPRAHEILKELRDISSMAMEHFEEKIMPTLKPPPHASASPRFSLSSSFSSFTSFSSFGASPGSSIMKPLSSTPTTSDELQHIITANKHNKNCINGVKREVSDLKSKLHEMRRKVSEQERVALEQNRIISDQATKLVNQEAKLNEVNRKLVEYEQRFIEVLASVGRFKEDGASSSTSTTKMTREGWRLDDNSKFYATHSLGIPTIGSTLFMTANMVQPNIMPVNLAAAQMTSPAYIATSQLGSYPTSGIVSSGAHTSTTSTLYAQTPQESVPLQSTSSHEPSLSTSNTAAAPAHTNEDLGAVAIRSLIKKHKKRKYSDVDGNQDSLHVKWKKYDD